MSIRLRLTLWYTAVLAGILLTLGVAVYRIFDTSLNGEINRSLQEVARDLQGSNTEQRAFLFANERIVIPRLDTFSLSTFYVQVWDVQGNLQGRSDNVAGYAYPLDPQALNEQVGRPVFRDLTLEDSEVPIHLRVLTLPLTTVSGNEQVVGWLQIATSVQPLYNARQQLLSVLLRGGIVGVFFSAVLGALLAHRALQPIDDVTQTAVQINRADDLGRRISYLGPPDEVGRLAGAFNEMLERLEQIFRAQERFLADVSHELRTPLTTIRGNTDLLRRMGGADAASLDAIQGETDRMIRLVSDLLLLAQADAGHLPMTQALVDIEKLVIEITHQTRVLAGERLEVQMEHPEPKDKNKEREETLFVHGDADRIRQLLLNLVDNAIKYTPDGGRVTLGLERYGHWVRLTVADTGIGIPPQDQPHIFDRFYRADKSRWRRPTSGNSGPGVGAGLGLSIAHWIVKAHGGRIEVTSEAGKGSAFYVWLPLAEAADQ